MFVDFEYAGKRLSDFGCMICNITSDSGVTTTNIGSQLQFNTIPVNNTTKFKQMSSEYTEAYTLNFQICKKTCNSNDNDYFSEMEIGTIMKWLNRKKFYKFKPIYDNEDYSMIYYCGSFNVQPITYGGNVIGMDLILQTDSPFAHYEPIEYNINLSGDVNTFTINDISDEIGYECYDIVVANILADVLEPLTPIVPKHLKKGGVYITSGIIDMKEEEVAEVIKAQPELEIVEITRKNDWVSITAVKK